ncbi:hypothetical protein [Lutibaculum baratangense]|uniref:DoxX family protein n=1 Tax=Lutibaculum baratangense AMV1 TaxID=631454 RepID=V4QY13_9HYPH|nr:hypothetical protein [Lutibaculum baratangense]ESR24642.1 hypothetical protein N177_2322 [Lutibaculum baratangense AMV1]
MIPSSQVALLLTRIGFALFLLVWGLNKILNPTGTAAIFSGFYGVDGLAPMLSTVLGTIQIAISLAIFVALWKTISYGLGVAIHGVSTVSTAPHLLLPLAEGSNLLFMAGLPVLLSAVGLFIARSEDRILSLDEMLERRALREA